MTTSTKPLLIVILGPTGSGKTDLAVEVAAHYSTEILSTDSRQVFKGMTVGSAQPSARQLARVKHHFIADRTPSTGFTAGEFEKEALAVLDNVFRTHRIAVAVGGSGLYIDALCNGFDDLPEADPLIRAAMLERLNENGLEDLLEELARLDPIFYSKVDKQNPARVMRALEVCLASGKPYSEQRTAPEKPRPFGIIKIGISVSREELYDRINRRVDAMMAEGLEAEARALYPFRALPALQTVGYKELFDFFDGLTSREEAVELIKRNTRRYAKRQMTWFRRYSDIEWITEKSVAEVEKIVKKFAE